MSAPSKDVQDNKTGMYLYDPTKVRKLYNPSTLNIDLVGGWFKNQIKNGQNASLWSDKQKYGFLVSQTIHPAENFISVNLLQIPCMIIWAPKKSASNLKI